MNTTTTKRAGFVGFLAAGALVLTACGGGGGGSAADWCSLVRTYQESADVMESSDDDASPSDMRAAMQEAKGAIDRMERAAPAEIRGDVTTIKRGFNDLIDALELVDYNFFALFGNPEAMAKMESMDTPEFEQAGERLDDYTEEQCGFRISDDESSTGFGSDVDIDFGDLEGMEGMEDLEGLLGGLDLGDLDLGNTDLGDVNLGDFGTGDMDMSFLIPMYESLYGINTQQATCLVERTFGDDPFAEDILAACGIDPATFDN